jgi:hypothetical protein
MNTNHTGVDASNMTDWKEFLEEEREFVESFDFLKDLAIDNPGLYFVLVCTLLNVWFMSYSKCTIWRQILKLSSNFGCLFTFCYLDGANSIKTDLTL